MSKAWPKGRAQRRARLFLWQLSNTRKALVTFHTQESGQMPTELISLNAPGGRLEVLPQGERRWLRVGQICPTLGIHERTFEKHIQRDPTLVPDGHTTVLPWPTPGGEQMVRVYSLDAVLNIAMEISNPQARRIRRWLVALLRGQAPVPRPPADRLAALPDARAMLAHPLVRQALAKLSAAAEADAAHARAQRSRRTEAYRLGALAGLGARDLHEVQKLERILARLPGLIAQPSLPLAPDA